MELNILDDTELSGRGFERTSRLEPVASAFPGNGKKHKGSMAAADTTGALQLEGKSNKKRLRSSGCDESTEIILDQDDLQPIEEQEEALDVQHVLEMTMTREAKIQEEIKVEKERCSSDDEGPQYDYGSDRDEGYVSFAGQAAFSKHSRKEAKKARRPKFERSTDAVVQVGSLTRAGNQLDPEIARHQGGFTTLGLSPVLSAYLDKQGYVSPTAVQRQGIPILLKGKDAMIESPTGSGKTLTYLIPIFENLRALGEKKISRSDGTFALILCPTRELCLQVLDVATILSRRYTWIVPGSIHGGENRSKEKARLRKGINILISTPGRLYDHLMNTTSFKTSHLRWMVLDEADRLLDMGFKKQIMSIFSVLEGKAAVHENWQLALFSATLHGIQDLLTVVPMKNPICIKGGCSIETDEGNNDKVFYDEIPQKLDQKYIVVPCKFRFLALFGALKQHMSLIKSAKILVFLSNCDSVDFYQILLQTKWDAIPTVLQKNGNDDVETPAILKLHGNMSQVERTRSLLMFTKASRGILLATDVASRGLDFPKISMIIQYDAPTSSEEYVHRVGRTARFGTSGESLLFVVPSECGFINYLHSQCGVISLNKSDTCSLLNAVYGRDAKAGKSIAMELHRGSNNASHALKTSLAQDKDLTSLAEMAFTSSVRAYATHSKELKDYFRIKNLHLGHYANSFGLKDKPMIAGKHGSSNHHRGKKSNDIRSNSAHSCLTFSQDQGFHHKQNRKKGNASSRSQKVGPHSKRKPSTFMYVSS